MIIYTDSLEGITDHKLQVFFVGWPNPPVAKVAAYLYPWRVDWLFKKRLKVRIISFSSLMDAIGELYFNIIQ